MAWDGLTCVAWRASDWSIKLWTALNTSPVLNFASGQDYVTDIQWSPTNSCVFGSVNRDGRVEVWNLGEKNPFDPAIKHHIEQKHLTCLTFSHNAPVILTVPTSALTRSPSELLSPLVVVLCASRVLGWV
jgi:WD40 repeat protein